MKELLARQALDAAKAKRRTLGENHESNRVDGIWITRRSQAQRSRRTIPRDNEALVQVHVVSINCGDVSFISGKALVVRLMGAGFLKPKITIFGHS